MPHGFPGKRTQLPSHDLLRRLLLPLEGTKLAFGCALKYGAVNPLFLPRARMANEVGKAAR